MRQTVLLTGLARRGKPAACAYSPKKPCHRGDGPKLGRQPMILGFGASNTDHPSLGFFVDFGLVWPVVLILELPSVHRGDGRTSESLAIAPGRADVS